MIRICFLVNVLMISMSCLILINFRAKDGSLIRAPLATSHHPQLFAPTRLSKNLVSNEFILASNEFILTVLFRKVISFPQHSNSQIELASFEKVI